MPKGKKAALPAAEQKLADAIAVAKLAEGKITDPAKLATAKGERKKLAAQLGALRFVRIANKRVPRTLAAIEGIGNLSGAGYVSNPAQVKTIVDALHAAVEKTKSALEGKAETVSGFSLPTT